MLFGVVNGICRIFWGILLDKFGFKILMNIIAIIEIISSSLIYYAVENDFFYILIVLLIATCLGGNFVCIIPLYTQIYGMDAGPRMFALTAAIIGILQFCGPLLVKFFLSEKKDYLIAFLIYGTFCVIKLVVLGFFDDKEKIKVHRNIEGIEKNKDLEKEFQTDNNIN